MRKIVFIGGGSSRFVRELVIDLFLHEELRDSHIALMDIDAEKLSVSQRLVDKIIREMDVPATCSVTTDRKQALEGADYVIITIMVGGFEKYKTDVEIPAKYGVFQTISDTTGPGALMRIVRTAPVLQGLASELQEVSPNAWVLNYANPMSMNTWTLLDAGHPRSVGLCHSIQGCIPWRLIKWLDIPADEFDYTAGGINHMNFYLSLTHRGRDLYPDLLACEEKAVEKEPAEKLAFELLRRLGHFPAEGPMHQAEYYLWFMKNEETGKRFGAVTGIGYKNDSANAVKRATEAQDILSGKTELRIRHSMEYGARIIQAMETGRALKIYGNVRNDGLIENLPRNAIVEVPCLVDRDSIDACRVGRIPPQLAAVMTPHIFLHEMAIDAVFRKSRRSLLMALQADPLTGAILTLPEIKDMFNELCEENKDYMAGWR